jgi:TPR repeat protein
MVGESKKNQDTALMWFTLAAKEVAEGGYAPAQYKLGVRYENGRGVETDYLQAYVWYRLAKNNNPFDSKIDFRLKVNRAIDNLSRSMTSVQLEKAEGMFLSYF